MGFRMRRFSFLFFSVFWTGWIFAFPLFGKDAPPREKNTALDPIALRLKTLSAQLEKMPELPRFNQTLELPNVPIRIPKREPPPNAVRESSNQGGKNK